MRRWRLLALAAVVAGCGSDGTGPSAAGGIHERLPAAGAEEVPVATDIRIEFTRDVTVPTDTAGAVRLERSGERVPVAVTRADARTLLVTPLDVLDPATSYSVHVGGALTGEQVVSWQFTTGGRARAGVDASRLLAHVRALAHDSMAGRGSATADELRAAGYIRTEFLRYGLEPYGTNGYFQSFTAVNLGSSQNVLGLLRGEGALQDDWVIVGAHYDHVGIRNGQVYNGADDNASGTAGMLELARVLSAHAAVQGFGTQDRRSMLFIAFGMEELGLVGSFFYCQNPRVPLSRLTGMLNLDMIGQLRAQSLYVIGEDTGREWSSMLRRYEPSLTYVALADAGTDHRCFRQQGRPVMSLFTGLHEHYHQPTDDPPTLDGTGMKLVADLALDLAINLAVRPRPLTPQE